MYSFDLLSINQSLTVSNINEYFCRPNVKIIIMFLYDDSFSMFPKTLGEAFSNLNFLSNEKIDVWTYYDRDSVSTPSSYEEESFIHQMVSEERFGTTKKMPYKNMDLLSKLFNTNISIAPTFILFNLEEQAYINVHFDLKLSPVAQIKNIINIIEDKEFNWNAISSYYSTTSIYLDIEDGKTIKSKLLDLKMLIESGLPLNNLYKEGYNGLFLDQYKKRYLDSGKNCDYIKLKDFLYNYKKLCVGNQLLLNNMEEICDKLMVYLHFNKSQSCVYTQLEQVLEDLSFSFLYYATNISLETELINAESGYSIACYCLGKIVENEINLGLVQKVREKLGIEMPQNYNKYKKNFYATVTVTNQSRENLCIDYNKRINGASFELRYPNISQTREFLFSNNQRACSESLNVYKEEINKEFSLKTLDCLRTINNIRNEATHSDKAMTKENYTQCRNAFDQLVNDGFFFINWRTKTALKTVM